MSCLLAGKSDECCTFQPFSKSNWDLPQHMHAMNWSWELFDLITFKLFILAFYSWKKRNTDVTFVVMKLLHKCLSRSMLTAISYRPGLVNVCYRFHIYCTLNPQVNMCHFSAYFASYNKISFVATHFSGSLRLLDTRQLGQSMSDHPKKLTFLTRPSLISTKLCRNDVFGWPTLNPKF